MVQSIYQNLQRYITVSLTQQANGAVVRDIVNLGPFVSNDIAVSTTSAAHPKFFYLGTLPKNHFTIVGSDTGTILVAAFTRPNGLQ